MLCGSRCDVVVGVMVKLSIGLCVCGGVGELTCVSCLFVAYDVMLLLCGDIMD